MPRHLRNLRPAELFSSLPIALPPRERRLTPLSAVRFGRGRPMALAAGEPLPERALTRPHFPPLLGRRNLRALEFQQERARPPVDLGDVSLPQRAASGRHSPAGPSRACSRQPDSALPLFDVRLADGRARSAAANTKAPCRSGQAVPATGTFAEVGSIVHDPRVPQLGVGWLAARPHPAFFSRCRH